MRINASCIETSITGMSLFTLRKHNNSHLIADVSITMETEIVKYLVKLVNQDQTKILVKFL